MYRVGLLFINFLSFKPDTKNKTKITQHLHVTAQVTCRSILYNSGGDGSDGIPWL